MSSVEDVEMLGAVLRILREDFPDYRILVYRKPEQNND